MTCGSVVAVESPRGEHIDIAVMGAVDTIHLVAWDSIGLVGRIGERCSLASLGVQDAESMVAGANP